MLNRTNVHEKLRRMFQEILFEFNQAVIQTLIESILDLLYKRIYFFPV